LAGVALAVAGSVLLLVTRGTWPIWCFFALNALSYSFISGTDEALIYDTKLELGERHETLASLSRFASAKYLFKIVVPLLAALVVKDLTTGQFAAVLVLDATTSLFAGFLALGLVEPSHEYHVVDQETGLFMKAWQVLRRDPVMQRAIVGRSLVMAVALVVWRPHTQQFIDLGLSPLELGVAWAVFHAVLFAWLQLETCRRDSRALEERLNTLNVLFLATVAVFIAFWYCLPSPRLLLVAFLVVQFTDVIRWPKYSELFNRRAASFSRATTVSMANALKSVLDIPFMLLAASLLPAGLIMPWWLALVAAAAVAAFFRLPVGKAA
jgi:hypothetical protein